jgi:hypothetical protein
MPNERELKPALVIVYRQLVLFHGTDKGLQALLPSDNHDGTIRDIRSDTTWELSEATITLLSDGRALTGQSARVMRNDRLLSFNEIVGDVVRPMDNPPVNATVDIPGGTLTAFPSSAFPEFAEEKWQFPRPKKEKEKEKDPLLHKVTDTCIFHLPLDRNKTYHLQIKSPRLTAVIEVSGKEGRRLEVKNADRKLGEPPANPFDLRDYEKLAALVDIPLLPPLPPAFMRQAFAPNFMCDEIVVCPTAYCGNPDK